MGTLGRRAFLSENNMIHQYKLNGYNIVIDTASGSVHSVDNVAYDAISMFELNTREEITEALLEKYSGEPDITKQEINDLLDDIQSLKDGKELFSIASCEAGFQLKNAQSRCEGTLPAYFARLQPKLRILFCGSGKISRSECAYEF